VDFELAISVDKGFGLCLASWYQTINCGAREVRFDLANHVAAPSAAAATVGTDDNQRKREYENSQADAERTVS
jgi:hypothetical protein